MRTCFFSFYDSFVFEPLERSLRCCQLIAKVWKGQINRLIGLELIFDLQGLRFWLATQDATARRNRREEVDNLEDDESVRSSTRLLMG